MSCIFGGMRWTDHDMRLAWDVLQQWRLFFVVFIGGLALHRFTAHPRVRGALSGKCGRGRRFATAFASAAEKSMFNCVLFGTSMHKREQCVSWRGQQCFA